jgi:alpha-L-arabinofuranosidase
MGHPCETSGKPTAMMKSEAPCGRRPGPGAFARNLGCRFGRNDVLSARDFSRSWTRFGVAVCSVCLLLLTTGSAMNWEQPWAGNETAQLESIIKVDVSRKTGQTDLRLFGQNVPFALSGVWNGRLNRLDASAETLIRPLSPTVLRFPGGTHSDQYLWEDGLSHFTRQTVTPGEREVLLDGRPAWESISRARFFDGNSGPFGDPFHFSLVDGARLKGVGGQQALHLPGARVRLEARKGQPEWFHNCYGINEHLRFAEAFEALPLITVNFGTGRDRRGAVSPNVSLDQRVKRAAAWVAYTNGDEGDHRELGVDSEGNDWRTVGYWAGRRSAEGHPQPFGVTTWEIGNEPFFRSEPGYTTASAYGRECGAFIRAMKAVDPKIKVGIAGMSVALDKGDADKQDPWNPTVIELTKGDADFLVVHPYFPSAISSQVSFRSETWMRGMMSGATLALSELRKIRAMLDACSPGTPGKGIAITEYGIWPADSTHPTDHSNLGAALFQADLLLTLLANSQDLGIFLATAWHLHSHIQSAAIHFDWKTGVRYVRPQYHVLMALRQLLKPELCQVTVLRGPSFEVEAFGNMPGMRSVPLINALATSDGDRSLTLALVNRSLTASVATAIQVEGFRLKGQGRLTELTANSLLEHNETNHQNVTPRTSLVDTSTRDVQVVLPPRCFTVIELAGSFDPASARDKGGGMQ